MTRRPRRGGESLDGGPPSGRRAGGRPGHVGHFRALVPLERVDAVVHHLFPTWHRFQAGDLDRVGLQGAIGTVEDHLATRLHAGQENPDRDAAGLCRSLLRAWPALGTFAEVDGVEPTNNAAERALRPAVLWRKGSFGTRSDAGTRSVERLLTVSATCTQHGRSVFAYLPDVCAAAQRGQPVPSLLTAPA